MSLNETDKAEIKRIMVEAMTSDNPGIMTRMVTNDLCEAKHKGVSTWMTVLTGLLAMTLTAAGWAAVRATEAAASLENVRQMVSSLSQQIGMMDR